MLDLFVHLYMLNRSEYKKNNKFHNICMCFAKSKYIFHGFISHHSDAYEFVWNISWKKTRWKNLAFFLFFWNKIRSLPSFRPAHLCAYYWPGQALFSVYKFNVLGWTQNICKYSATSWIHRSMISFFHHLSLFYILIIPRIKRLPLHVLFCVQLNP